MMRYFSSSELDGHEKSIFESSICIPKGRLSAPEVAIVVQPLRNDTKTSEEIKNKKYFMVAPYIFFKKYVIFFILKYHRAYVEKVSLFSPYFFQPSLQCAGQFFS